MKNITRAIKTTDVLVTLYSEVEGKEVTIPVINLTLEGEYKPLQVHGKVLRNAAVKSAVERILECNPEITSYDLISKCHIKEQRYTMTVVDFINHATVVGNATTEDQSTVNE